jgi:uncharacterized protein YjiS (DUF1127 family)
MMTQPIQVLENLTSETSPAGGNASNTTGSAYEAKRGFELRARHARSELLANFMTDAMAWVVRQCRAAVAAIKANYRLHRAEAQLHRMSDRELADLGLCRADIAFAIRQEPMQGVSPEIDRAAVGRVAAANQNMRRAA